MSHDLHGHPTRDGAPGTSPRDPEPPFTVFCETVRDLLDETAADKGYHPYGTERCEFTL